MCFHAIFFSINQIIQIAIQFSFLNNTFIQLTNRSSRCISRICKHIFSFIFPFLIYSTKFTYWQNYLSPNLKWNRLFQLFRNRLNLHYIFRNIFSNLSVTSSNPLFQNSIFINQANTQSIQFKLQNIINFLFNVYYFFYSLIKILNFRNIISIW